jgi:hypothetical protein
MKTFCAAILALGTLAAMTAEADAFVCGAGPYRAGCVGPRGAIVAPRYGYGYRYGVARPYGYARPYYARPYVRPYYRPYY